MDFASQIKDSVNAVTNQWAKQRKAEERSLRSRQTYFQVKTIPLRDYVFMVIADAYAEVSDNDTLPAHARQLMYSVRRRIQQYTDATFKDSYFTQQLLPEYMRNHAPHWNVVYDPRGEFHEPHTAKRVQLGTLAVREYLECVETGAERDMPDYNPEVLYPTRGSENRFSGVLFLEKEGFWPLFRSVKLAERYDLAVMSTKGLSNVASRQLIDAICEQKLPLFILRDCDAAGFTIAKTLTANSERYEFEHDLHAIDLGLRKIDADHLELESEAFHSKENKSSMAARLRTQGATSDEVQMIAVDRRRIELNAFPSRKLVDFIEAKLDEHGVQKVIPSDATLEAAWRRSYAIQWTRREFETLSSAAKQRAMAQAINANTLRAQVKQKLEQDPALPWDAAVAELANDKYPE